MRKRFSKFGIIAALMLVLTTVFTVPAYAATKKEVPISAVGVQTGIVLKKGASIKLGVYIDPYNTTYTAKVSYSWPSGGFIKHQAYPTAAKNNYVSPQLITAVKTGSCNIKVTVKIYDSRGKYVRTHTFTTKCTVVDDYSMLRKTGTTTTTTTKTVALKSISLSRTSLTLTTGSTFKLTVSYSPTNTTVNRTVTWGSTNSAVATVNAYGVVTAKKAGTATITARVGNKTTRCTVTVKAKATTSTTTKPTTTTTKPATSTTTTKPATSTTKPAASTGSFRNVSDAYTYLNNFRTTRANQWYLNPNNRTRTYTYGLGTLRRDAALERTAQIRAQEAWSLYYERGIATHDRPNGSECWTAYPSGIRTRGENLAFGQTSSYVVVMDGTYGWAETNYNYANQAHRRNMLDSRFTKVGIACYEKDGKTCWAMCLGS